MLDGSSSVVIGPGVVGAVSLPFVVGSEHATKLQPAITSERKCAIPGTWPRSRVGDGTKPVSGPRKMASASCREKYTAAVFRQRQRRVVLPDGELKRAHLSDVPEEELDEPPQARRRATPLVLAWLGLTFVCFQWSEGRVGFRSWTLPIGEALKQLIPHEAAPTTEMGFGAMSRPSESVQPGLALPGSEGASQLESAATVRAPSGAPVSPSSLPIHQGSFQVVREEPLSLANNEWGSAGEDPTQLSVLSDETGGKAYAGPGCEGARRQFVGREFLEEEDPAVLRLLNEQSRYLHCKPELMSLRICALVHKGRAIGVTVQTEPPSRPIGVCAAIVAKTLTYPRNAKPQVVRTEVYFQ